MLVQNLNQKMNELNAQIEHERRQLRLKEELVAAQKEQERIDKEKIDQERQKMIAEQQAA